MRVLVLNPGSSTLKASLVDTDGADAVDALADWPAAAEGALAVVRAALEQLPTDADAVGYRVVHGGPTYRSATRVDEAMLLAIEALDALAPLHNRRAAMVIRAALELLPDVPHVACFDTAFHATLPEAAWRYPLPRDWVERWGIRRFGFHGISVAWSVRRAAELLERPIEGLRVVVAHLGSGCSVTAVEGGRSVATSMGLTPYEGMMMGTRSGSVDPGILLHLIRGDVSADELAVGLAERSGLLAVAGTPDLREIESRAGAGDELARLATAMFADRAAAAIGAAMTALPSVDALVFTGGIGEHSATMRDAIARRLASVGLPKLLVVEAREDLVIAAEVEASVSA